MHTDLDATKISEALVTLGSTCEEVHQKLLELGCKGEVGSRMHCPVAYFLSKRFTPNDLRTPLRVDESTVSEIHGDFYLPLPQPVKEFVAQFDNGGFPELLADKPFEVIIPCPTTNPSSSAPSATP